jgi:hypothetical protein
MLRKRILSLGISALALAALISGPAAARTTVTVTCESGVTFTADSHAAGGLTTANTAYNNAVDGADFCSLS